MSPSFAEVRIPIELDKLRYLVFDANTMLKYEEVSGGKRYFQTLSEMFATYDKHNVPVSPEDPTYNPEQPRRLNLIAMMQELDVQSVIKMLWAALHTYDKDENPTWDFKSHERLARHVGGWTVCQIIPLIVAGHLANSPTAKEVGESKPVAENVVAMPTKTDQTPADDGGTLSTEQLAAGFI